MRTVKLQVQTSMDGFIARPGGEMDFVIPTWDDELIATVRALTDPVSTILLGRVLAQGFIPYWDTVANDPAHPAHEAGRKFTTTEKFVFSHTLMRPDPAWQHTTLTNTNLHEFVQQLRQQSGGDIMAYGGARFVSQLLRDDLVDEVNLFVNPTAIGSGLAIWAQLPTPRTYQLVQAKAYACGVVHLQFRRAS